MRNEVNATLAMVALEARQRKTELRSVGTAAWGLQVERIECAFCCVHALNDVSLIARPRGIAGLFAPNGAASQC